MKTESTKNEKSSKMAPAAVAKHDHAENGSKGTIDKAEHKVEATVETLLPVGSWRRLAAGVAAAAGGGLFAAAWVGAGPAAIAGAAGYLAYRKLQSDRTTDTVKH